MRIKTHTDHCLLLDFAGVVQTHGPIVNVQPPTKGGNGTGVAPVKVCEKCHELVALAALECPECGWKFPERKPKKLQLHNDDIMGQDNNMIVKDWQWRRYTAASGKEMVTVTYYGNFFESVTEYLCLLHGGYAGDKAVRTLLGIARRVGADIHNPYDLDEVVSVMSAVSAPNRINRQKDGKFYRVTARYWDDEQSA